MKEIREIFETVRTYCGMMFLENRAAKQLGSEAAKRNCHLEKKQPLSVVIPSDSEGSQPIKIERLVAYPSKSSLTREDLCYGKVAHDNNFDSPETVYSLLTTHHSLKHAAFTLAEGATHVAHCDKFCRAAFTLAEVLITLGIIGVVAALTLPTLIQNHQKQVYVTQLKKAYSTLGNAFNKMAVDEGVVDWDQTYCAQIYGLWGNGPSPANEELNECFNNLTKQMNVIKKKEFGETVNNADWCGNVCQADNYYVFMTSDGVTINSCAYFDLLVDVNGVKSPNVEGRDIFAFWVDFSNNKIIPGGSYGDYWKNCSATNLSTSCTAKVLIEGKMNY